MRNHLRNSALNALLRIKVSKISVETFHKEHGLSFVNFWYNKKGRWLLQRKQKRYKKRGKRFLKDQRSTSQQYLLSRLCLKALSTSEVHANEHAHNSWHLVCKIIRNWSFHLEYQNAKFNCLYKCKNDLFSKPLKFAGNSLKLKVESI